MVLGWGGGGGGFGTFFCKGSGLGGLGFRARFYEIVHGLFRVAYDVCYL